MGSCISCKMKETNGNGDNVVIPPLSRNGNRNMRRITECNIPDFLEQFKKKIPKIIYIRNDSYLKRTNNWKCKFPLDVPNQKECLICWKKICKCECEYEKYNSKKCNSKKFYLKTCCDQYYHVNCLNAWMKCKSLCPICKNFIIILSHIDYDKKSGKKKIVGYETHTYKLYNLYGDEIPIQHIWEPPVDMNRLFSDEDDYEDELHLELLEESLEESLEELLEESLEEPLEEPLEESLEESLEEKVESNESSYEIIENNVVIPPLSEVERFVEESADRESVVVREIIFSNSTTQVI